MTVTYRELEFTSPFTAIAHEKKFNAISYFRHEGTSLLYFKLDRFNYKTVAVEDIIKIEEV